MTLEQAIQTLDRLIGRRAGSHKGRYDSRACLIYVGEIDYLAVPNCRIVCTDGTPANDFRDGTKSVLKHVTEVVRDKKSLEAESMINAATQEEIEASLEKCEA